MWNILYSLKLEIYRLRHIIRNNTNYRHTQPEFWNNFNRPFSILSVDERHVYPTYLFTLSYFVLYKNTIYRFFIRWARLKILETRKKKGCCVFVATPSPFLHTFFLYPCLCLLQYSILQGLWKQWTSWVGLWLCLGQNNTRLYIIPGTMGNGGTKLKRSCFFWCLLHNFNYSFYYIIPFILLYVSSPDRQKHVTMPYTY